MLIVGMLFAIIGTILPNFYFQYLDTTEYFKINSVSINKYAFTAGETVEVTLDRTAKTNFNGFVVRELTLVNIVNNKTILAEAYRESLNVTVDKGTKNILLYFTLPEELEHGTYFWRGTISYQINNNSKTTTFVTDTFIVL